MEGLYDAPTGSQQTEPFGPSKRKSRFEGDPNIPNHPLRNNVPEAIGKMRGRVFMHHQSQDSYHIKNREVEMPILGTPCP